jgi:hypothetical protein
MAARQTFPHPMAAINPARCSKRSKNQKTNSDMAEATKCPYRLPLRRFTGDPARSRARRAIRYSVSGGL